MLAFFIGVPIIPVLIALGVLASQLYCFSIPAYKVLNCLPNIMITTYLAIDDILHELGKGKVIFVST